MCGCLVALCGLFVAGVAFLFGGPHLGIPVLLVAILLAVVAK